MIEDFRLLLLISNCWNGIYFVSLGEQVSSPTRIDTPQKNMETLRPCLVDFLMGSLSRATHSTAVASITNPSSIDEGTTSDGSQDFSRPRSRRIAKKVVTNLPPYLPSSALSSTESTAFTASSGTSRPGSAQTSTKIAAR